MAQSAASAGWGPGGRFVVIRWGHHAPQILIAAIVTSVLLVLRPIPPGTPSAVLAPLVLVGVVLSTWAQLRQHDRSLCELCMASMPLDAPAAAHRYAQRLRVAHLASSRVALGIFLGVLVGCDVSLLVVPSSWTGAANLAWACVQASLIYLVVAHTTHRRLQPWCPECRDGGGGTDVSQSGPVPSDLSSR